MDNHILLNIWVSSNCLLYCKLCTESHFDVPYMQQLPEDFLHTELLDHFNFNVFVILMDIAKVPSIEIVPIYFPTSKV